MSTAESNELGGQGQGQVQGTSPEKKKQAESQRRRDIAEIAKRQSEENIARELERAQLRRGPESQNEKSSDRASRPPRPEFIQMARLMLERQKITGEIPAENVAPLELALREINRATNFAELKNESDKKAKRELILQAYNTLQALSNQSDAVPQGMDDNTFRELFKGVLAQTKEAMKGAGIDINEVEQTVEADNKKSAKGEKKQETSKPEGVIDKKERARQEKSKRVANHRDLKKIEKRIRALEKKTDRTKEENNELVALQNRRNTLLIDQLRSLSESPFMVKETGREGESKQSCLDVITTNTITKILEKDSIRPGLLKTEKERLEELQRLLISERNLTSLLTTKITAEDIQPLSLNQIRLLELISDPKILSRIEISLEKVDLEKQGEMAELADEFVNYEEWRRTGPVEERITAAREDFMTMIMLLNSEDFDELDLYLRLQEFNLGDVTFTENGEYDFVPEPNLDPENSEKNKKYKKEIQDMLELAKQIRTQHQMAWELVGYPEDRDIDKQEERRKQTIQALNNDIKGLFNLRDNDLNLEDLFNKRIVDLEISPTGISLVVNSHLIAGSEEEYNQLLLALGVKENSIEDIKANGMGATIENAGLINFKNLIEGTNFDTVARGKNITPSVNIIVLTNNPTLNHDVGTRLQKHETTDYLLDEFHKDYKLANVDPEKITPEGTRLNRAYRELSSRITEEVLEKGEIKLDDLYILKHPNPTPAERELYYLIKDLERILKPKQIAQTEDQGSEPAKKDREQLLEDSIRRSQLAFNLRTLLEQQDPSLLPEEKLASIRRQLAEMYPYLKPTESRDIQNAELFSDRESPLIEEALKDNTNIKYAASGMDSLFGVTDSTNPLNKKQLYTDTQQMGGKITWYGEAGKAAYNTRLEFADEGWGFRPLSTIQGFRTVGRLPIVGGIMDRTYIPIPGLASYNRKRAIAARYAHSMNPKLRRWAEKDLGSADLGAKPIKFWAWVSPEMEHRLKEYLPGYNAAHNIAEERENLPTSLAMGVYDKLYSMGPQWFVQIGASDGQIDQQEMLRYLNELSGVKYEFKGQTYQFGIDHNDLKETTRIGSSELSILEDVAKDKLFGTGHLSKYSYAYDGKRYSPNEGLIRSLMLGSLRRGPGKRQQEVSKFFKKHARRSDLPDYMREGMFYWERQIGEDFRDYLRRRDGLMAFRTLGHEHNEAAKEKKHYSFFEMVNLIHYAEEQLIDNGTAWLQNNTGKTIHLEIRERGQTKKVSIAPGENLRDEWGNLIPRGVELVKGVDKNPLIINGKLQADISDETTNALWGRVVGDYENPHLRFIRLKSQDSMRDAVSMFGTNEDDGYDSENVRLRTDGIKWALDEYRFAQMRKALEEGIPPDRRYDMEFMKIKDPITGIDRHLPIIKFKQEVQIPGGPKINVFDASGNATDDFRDYVKAIIDSAKGSREMSTVADYLEKYEKFFDKTKVFNRQETSRIFEHVLRAVSRDGKTKAPEDAFFESFINFSPDDSWGNPYRQEQEAILPKSKMEVDKIMDSIKGGYRASERRFNTAQTYLYAWQKAVKKVAQFERFAYTATAHFKGLAKFSERATNLALLASTLTLMYTGSPMAFTAILLSLYGRYKFKPWLVHEQKKWGERRKKALGRLKEIKSLDSIFEAAMKRGVTTEYDLERMYSTGEEINYWLEDLSQTDAPDDWFPEHDTVISTLDKIREGVKEQLKKYGT